MTDKNKMNVLSGFPKKISVLGEEYKILFKRREDDEKLDGADGYCEFLSKEIIIDKSIFTGGDESPLVLKKLDLLGLKVIRHELIHAFIYESGLSSENKWAENEELVDWIALQFPKLKKCFEKIGVSE